MSDFDPARAIKTGLIGHPVSQSKSPLLHGYWMQKHHIQGTYSAVDLPCEDLKNGVDRLIAQGFKGFNVTVPHKIAIMDLCKEIDDTARIVGAVNTVRIENGTLFGTNTDVFGFIENIRAHQPHFNFKGCKTLVLGAGGAARAVVQGLIDAGAAQVRIANRTRKNADELLVRASAPEKIAIVEWAQREDRNILGDIDLVVNTTSLGMAGKPPLEMDLGALPDHAVVNDIVYAPLMTDLLLAAQAKDNPVVTGIGMLLHQARPAFALWHGICPDVDEDLLRQVMP